MTETGCSPEASIATNHSGHQVIGIHLMKNEGHTGLFTQPYPKQSLGLWRFLLKTHAVSRPSSQ